MLYNLGHELMLSHRTRLGRGRQLPRQHLRSTYTAVQLTHSPCNGQHLTGGAAPGELWRW